MFGKHTLGDVQSATAYTRPKFEIERETSQQYINGLQANAINEITYGESAESEAQRVLKKPNTYKLSKKGRPSKKNEDRDRKKTWVVSQKPKSILSPRECRQVSNATDRHESIRFEGDPDKSNFNKTLIKAEPHNSKDLWNLMLWPHH